MVPRQGKRRGQGGSRPDSGMGEGPQDSQAPDDPNLKHPHAGALPAVRPPTEAPSTFSTLSEAQRHDDSHFASPNTSPAPAPTETPASTPVRPGVERLDSLGLSGRSHSTGRAGMGGRVMAGKFKPKPVTRRALADRVQAQREGEERRRESEIEAQKEQDANSYGRMHGFTYNGNRNRERGGVRGRVRGRGEAMGRGGIDRNTKAPREASGLFGIAPAASVKKLTSAPPQTSTTRARPASDSMDVDTQNIASSLNAGFSRLSTRSGKPYSSPTSSRVKQDPDTLMPPTIEKHAGVENDTQSAKVKVEVLDPIYPEEQEEGSQPAPRVNIELINLITDDEDEDEGATHSTRNKGKGRSLPSKYGLKPVRLQREEHKERVTLVNTEPAAINVTDEAREPADCQVYVSTDDEYENQIELSRDNEKWSGVWQDDKIEAKHDPDASIDAMDVDSTIDPNDLTKNSQVSGGRDLTASASIEKEKTKRNLRPQKTRLVLQTEEDKAEHTRRVEDLRILAEELGGVSIDLTSERDAGTTGLDEESITGQPRVEDHEGRLYLFQFPPALPTLINKIKEEATDGSPDLMEVETGPANVADTIDLTKPDPEEAITVETPNGPVQVPPEMVTEEGFVGKLIVRKSGRVQMDWGGVLLDLGRGVQSDYLTTTLIIEGLSVGGLSDTSAKPVGTGTGMGKVMGNFVMKPDFEAMDLM